jgi:general secretion pathway protein D
MSMIGKVALVLVLSAVVVSCAAPEKNIRPAELAVENTAPPSAITPNPDPENSRPAQDVGTTIVAGRPLAIQPVQPVRKFASGNISLNFPDANVNDVAKAVLGDLLKMPYSVAPNTSARVSVVTPKPIARTAVLQFLEDALKPANLALIAGANMVSIAPIDQARTQAALVTEGATGFGSETVNLKFVSVEEMRKIIDPILPGVISRVDTAQNTLIMSGTSGQRANVRELLKQFDVNWLRSMSFGLFIPKRTDARLIVPELDKLLNSDGAPTKGLVRLISMERINGILAISTQRQYLEDVTRWIEILDREGQNSEPRLFVYRVQNGRSSDLAKVLNNALGGPSSGSTTANEANTINATSTGSRTGSTIGGLGSGSRDQTNDSNSQGQRFGDTAAASQTGGANGQAKITSDDTNNAILVFGTPKEYAVVEDALRQLDIIPYQVMIEAAITEVTLTDKLRYGLQYDFTRGDTTTTLSDGLLRAPARVFPGFSFFYSNNSSIAATLNALENLTTINVVSAPKLLVLNNQTASLQVGDQVPVATGSSVSTQNADAPVVNTIEYRDTGVILKITPRVNASGLVLLDVAQEVSDVAQNTSSSINSPTISTRRIASTVAVQDGQTIALGGLIRDSRNSGKNGIPYLSRIPVVGGFLFGNTSKDTRRTELLILLKPRVIRSVDEGRIVTEELRAKLRSINPLPGYGELP